MRRALIFLSLFLSVIVLSACCSTLRQSSTPELVKQLNNATVALVYPTENTVKPFCTGVWISETNILTAHHCINGLLEVLNEDKEDADKLEAKDIVVPYILENEVVNVGELSAAIHFSKVEAVSDDTEADLALLKVINPASVPNHNIAKITHKAPEIGEHINVVGHPKGLYWSYISGVVSAYRQSIPSYELNNGPYMQISAPIFFGNSGGGAFNDDGELVGIADYLLKPPNTGLFVHFEAIRDWLHKHKLANF